ncbi:hypothetical protein [Bacteroides gallinarum]|uniref:hypothetical protein n=1 Tax=Bacteroides gallinarum TaxID=376806 RepID=UPI001F498579|nr:hypothetical protein [Bacteroides gallinarum]
MEPGVHSKKERRIVRETRALIVTLSPHKSVRHITCILTAIFLLQTAITVAQNDSLRQKNALTDSIWQIGEIEITARKKVPLLQATAIGQWNISRGHEADTPPAGRYRPDEGYTTAARHRQWRRAERRHIHTWQRTGA